MPNLFCVYNHEIDVVYVFDSDNVADAMIDIEEFKDVFNIISVISWQLVHLSMLSWCYL